MATSLLDWIMDLMRDGGAREAFNSNPQAAMASAGFTNVCGSDVRPFLFDEPSIREVAGVELPEVQGEDAPQDIRYIINNYTIEAPTTNGNSVVDGGNVIDGPTDDGPETGPITGDGNTVTQEEANTTAQEDNDTESGNTVAGDGSAGEDQIQDSAFTDISEGIQGDGNTNLLVLQENLNDLHALSDLVNIDDTLNGSLNDSLNSLATNALQNATDLVDVL
jgi:hypothetical protein